ncbi:hypothetical protein [Rhizobium leguminosarum]|uniref:hypothetical protein n=1 Tax=Rhizobium leguminosarum TaxID=384 RepID=UPI00103262AA|nr:hypothetical protein [Rhizobium leguminosarum]TAU90103.1 hypothetical protein ELI41_16960 [Rhizobium leguminosarum]TAV54756.1 hypothetical protein ELI29_17655 [Rhizobium leguminosarum]
MGSITISTIDIERSIVDVAGICRCMGQNATPFLRRLEQCGATKKVPADPELFYQGDVNRSLKPMLACMQEP